MGYRRTDRYMIEANVIKKTIVLAHSSRGSKPSRLSNENGIMEGRGRERSHSETRSQRLRKGISVTTLF